MSTPVSTPGQAVAGRPLRQAGLQACAVRRVAVAALLVAACLLPFGVSGYVLFQLTMVLIYALALLGLNLLTGFNGQISLGHGAFYAIGGYTTAILLDHGWLPYWAAVPAGGAVCLLAGYLFGLPASRLGGLYLALATFALAIATPQLLKYRAFEAWTGGTQGIILDKPDPPFGLPLDADQWMYLVCLAVVAPMTVVVRNLLRGRTGRALVAIRDHPLAAQAMGIDIAWYKSATFGISALYTGLAGGLGAIATGFVSPDSFPVFLSISLLVGIVVGGIASIPGALFGAVFIEFVPTLVDQVSKAAPWALYGAVLIGFMYVMPTGVAGLLQRLGRRLGTARAHPSANNREEPE